jgi:hypothetical protein
LIDGSATIANKIANCVPSDGQKIERTLWRIQDDKASRRFQNRNAWRALAVRRSSHKNGKDDFRRLMKKFVATPGRGKLPYVKRSSLLREYIILRHYLHHVIGSGIIPGNRRFSALRGYFTLKKEIGRVHFSKRRFQALADPNKVVLVPPQAISYKLKYDLDIYFGDILSGEWDQRRRVEVESSSKHRAVYERYVLGLPWEETEAFKTIFAARLARGERVRGVDNLADLAKQYCEEVDGLFASMQRNGFVIAKDRSGRPETLPHVHIGRNGEFLFGNNGNHRLAIAKVLGLKHIPCWVRGRHLLWQQTRERVAAEIARGQVPIEPPLAAHPDLADLLGIAEQEPTASATSSVPCAGTTARPAEAAAAGP